MEHAVEHVVVESREGIGSVRLKLLRDIVETSGDVLEVTIAGGCVTFNAVQVSW